ncbi:DUF937 domain-containing protein [Deinococcus planocerae]|uniref:DUF937 domain-containing protein n=1 Tax=Deinococcus planocerae TaxID=1737569 RepID=UPI000C7EFCEA|nr:DUF937 domain-containing protein [Deinococcus planocerae]
MNGSEEWQTFFGPVAAERLAREAGLGPAEAGRVLREGLPLLLAALADHARTPEGERQLNEAIQNLPRFASVPAALESLGGAGALQRAGQLLGPALLGPRAVAIAERVTGASAPAGVQTLLHLTLPLVLSVLGQRGGLSGLPSGPARLVVSAVPGPLQTAGGAVDPPARAPAGNTPPGGLSPQELTEFLRGQFGGVAGVRLGTLAGFGDGSAAQATQAALAVVLGAVARKGRTEAAAGVILGHGGDFERLVDADGSLNPHLLGDPARVAGIEGQGRRLLGTLFGHASGVGARLGSALGAPEENAGRLLALLTPLVLGLLVRRARTAGLGARHLAALLAGLGPHLPGLLPAGPSGLGALLEAEPVPSPAAGTGGTPRPGAAVAPAPARRRGPRWWLIPLLLVPLAGGLSLLWSRSEQPPVPGAAGAAGTGVTVRSPAPGAELPLADLTLRGTGRPGDLLTVEDGGLEVASTRVGGNGTWQVTLPTPTLGEHTYTVRGSEGATSGEIRVTVTAGDDVNAGEVGGGPDEEPAAGPSAPPSETFDLAEPAPGAQLPAGSFTLRGRGTPGESLQILEDDTSLGNVTVGPGGTWRLDVPSPSPGPHTYAVYAQDATELGRVEVTVDALASLSPTGVCDREYTLSLTDGQTVREPFRFGGTGQGEGYRVTVRRAGRVVGVRDIPLDPTCGWSYQSRPGPGPLSYEVRPLASPGAAPLSVITITVRP